MATLSLTALIKIELPSDTILLCDGGFLTYSGDTYTSLDSVWGAIESVTPLVEGVGATLPAVDLTFLPPSATGPGDVTDPTFQNSRVRCWLAQYVPATGLVTGTPTLMFDGMIDQVSWTASKIRRRFTVHAVTRAEKLFSRNIGNSLSPVFQKIIWSGDTGMDNATGITMQVAWGVEAPNNNAVTTVPSYAPGLYVPGA